MGRGSNLDGDACLTVPELLAMADRIGVFYEGQLAAVLPVDESVLASLGKVMAGENMAIGLDT